MLSFSGDALPYWPHIPLLMLLASCSTFGRATHPDEAVRNCEVLQALVDEHCAESDETLSVECVWSPRITLGKADYLESVEGCVTGVCGAALQEAEEQCERGSLAHFRIEPPSNLDLGECCPEPSEDCKMVVGCL